MRQAVDLSLLLSLFALYEGGSDEAKIQEKKDGYQIPEHALSTPGVPLLVLRHSPLDAVATRQILRRKCRRRHRRLLHVDGDILDIIGLN
jgi:hypothetical protein